MFWSLQVLLDIILIALILVLIQLIIIIIGIRTGLFLAILKKLFKLKAK